MPPTRIDASTVQIRVPGFSEQEAATVVTVMEQGPFANLSRLERGVLTTVIDGAIMRSQQSPEAAVLDSFRQRERARQGRTEASAT